MKYNISTLGKYFTLHLKTADGRTGELVTKDYRDWPEGAKRMEDLPDVPTLKEAGADVDAVLWSGIFMPKATPPAIVRKLEAEFMRIAKLPDVIARLKPLGIDTVGNSSEEFAKILAADIARWGEVAKAANIKIEQ